MSDSRKPVLNPKLESAIGQLFVDENSSIALRELKNSKISYTTSITEQTPGGNFTISFKSGYLTNGKQDFSLSRDKFNALKFTAIKEHPELAQLEPESKPLEKKSKLNSVAGLFKKIPGGIEKLKENLTKQSTPKEKTAKISKKEWQKKIEEKMLASAEMEKMKQPQIKKVPEEYAILTKEYSPANEEDARNFMNLLLKQDERTQKLIIANQEKATILQIEKDCNILEKNDSNQIKELCNGEQKQPVSNPQTYNLLVDALIKKAESENKPKFSI